MRRGAEWLVCCTLHVTFFPWRPLATLDACAYGPCSLASPALPCFGMYGACKLYQGKGPAEGNSSAGKQFGDQTDGQIH